LRSRRLVAMYTYVIEQLVAADMLKTRAESSHEDCLPEMQRNCLLAGDGTC
jgi:flagellin-specific chaperone FliS